MGEADISGGSGVAPSRRSCCFAKGPAPPWGPFLQGRVTTADLADQVGDGRESEEDTEAEPVQLRAEELGSVSRL